MGEQVQNIIAIVEMINNYHHHFVSNGKCNINVILSVECETNSLSKIDYYYYKNENAKKWNKLRDKGMIYIFTPSLIVR